MKVLPNHEILILLHLCETPARRCVNEGIDCACDLRATGSSRFVVGAKNDLAVVFDGFGKTVVTLRMFKVGIAKHDIVNDSGGVFGCQPLQ